MSRVHACRFERHIDAPVDVVWDVLTDHARYDEWTPLPHARLVTPGRSEPNGVGAVRFLGLGPMGTREEVVVHDAPSHLAYTVVAGLPVRDYRADARLIREGDATRLEYEGRFSAAVPGTGPVLALLVRTALRTLVSSLVRESERRAAAAAA